MQAQHSVARQWNEVQLNCIRKDAARPTVQARNLGHAAILMYDLWAVYDNDASPFFLGRSWGEFNVPFEGVPVPDDIAAASEEAISYAMYRFLYNRYSLAPGWLAFGQGYVETMMNELGYDPSVTSTDYLDGDPAKLGNYLAAMMQQFALQDGSNQQNNYANQYYQTVNGDLHPQLPGNPFQFDGNRWQPLSLTLQLDQNGFPLANGAPALSAEWGNVVPFSLTEADKTVHERDGNEWNVYLDPGPPPLLDYNFVSPNYDDDFFKWGNILVSLWHSLHDIGDGVLIDISPNSIGNVDVNNLPETFEEYKNFYNDFEGGDPGTGYTVNPATGMPYEPQMVPRGDYTRVLSEFWADGPNSETPPGHWFTIINYVSDHPAFEKRWEGTGPIMDILEWDVRAYFALGGAIHDAAIACWSAKGFYDYTRPIMAIRFLCDRGQSTDIMLPNYDTSGIPLIPGFIEQVQPGDPLAGPNDENLYKIKLYTWRGPVAATGQDGVGWILGENWWTFQKHTFVTPPFPGYYSGHSTYSRTAAEVLSRITGDEYFPGGMAEFTATANQYLTATTGPSVNVVLQWAKYADASDQCSLSRIYGGLHPPQDDIPGRKNGLIIGPQAYSFAESFMDAGLPHVLSIDLNDQEINTEDAGQQLSVTVTFSEEMDTSADPIVTWIFDSPVPSALQLISVNWINNSVYELIYQITASPVQFDNVVLQISEAKDTELNYQVPALSPNITINIIDESCPGDFNNDGAVNINDLLLFVSEYGCTSECGVYDMNNDTAINIGDLLIFMSSFGSICQ